MFDFNYSQSPHWASLLFSQELARRHEASKAAIKILCSDFLMIIIVMIIELAMMIIIILMMMILLGVD